MKYGRYALALLLVASPANAAQKFFLCGSTTTGAVNVRPKCKPGENHLSLAQLRGLDGLQGPAGPRGPQGPAGFDPRTCRKKTGTQTSLQGGPLEVEVSCDNGFYAASWSFESLGPSVSFLTKGLLEADSGDDFPSSAVVATDQATRGAYGVRVTATCCPL